eukprot:XP_011667404.1 PREDICTED: ankyrin-1-like [Strongylocentrotus purpuratus]
MSGIRSGSNDFGSGECSSYGESQERELESVSVSGSQMAAPQKTKKPSSLLQLVKAENPSIDEAKHLLSDRTPDDISQAIEQKDSRGNSVIHYACAKALVPWVELLIVKGADLNVEGKDGQRPIHFTVKGEAKNVSQQEAKSGIVTSPLFHITCQNDQFENAMLLLKHGADPLAKDRVGEDTPLHIILRKKQVKHALRFLEICKKNGHDMPKILLARNANQQCVIHEAVKCGDKELVTYCIEHVSKPDDYDDLLYVRSRNTSTLMHTACRHGHVGIVKMLAEMCPKLLESRSESGYTPLHASCSRNQAEYAAKQEAIDCLVVLLYRREDESTLFEFLEWISVEEGLCTVLQVCQTHKAGAV